jgi:NAD(P)H-hydrate epimerase
MRRIEAASDAQGHTYAAMMERAGSAVARVIQAGSEVRGQRILVLVGPGNNGGDGLVAARHVRDAGAEVGVFLLKPRDDEHVAALRERGVGIALWSDNSLQEWLDSCAVIVDALLGTGTARPIEGDLANLLIAVRRGVGLPLPCRTSSLLRGRGLFRASFDSAAPAQDALPLDRRRWANRFELRYRWTIRWRFQPTSA